MSDELKAGVSDQQAEGPGGTASGPTYADVLAARAVIEGVAHRTPVVTSRRINQELGCSVYFKCENLQRIGAFKFRGAYNALHGLAPEQRNAGVVAYSSGNHAQAVALAGSLLGIDTTIVMPTNAPRIKLDATRGYGATVITYDPFTDNRAAVAEQVRSERGATMVPPFDHPAVIAGQGTAAAELLEEVPDLDAVLTPVGGGGLLAGTTLAVKGASPSTLLYGAEPAAGDDAARSLHSGRLVQIAEPQTHLADGARTESLGSLTWPIIRDGVSDIFTITDQEIRASVVRLAETLKLVVEPTGAMVLPGARAVARRHPGARIGVIISGGNLDLSLIGSFLTGAR